MSQPTLFDPRPPAAPLKARFDGPEYRPADDDARLTAQLRRVYDAIKDGQWRTVAEISAITGDPPTSVSAQLRHLRKQRFGAWNVAKRKRAGSKALFEFRLNGHREALPPVRRGSRLEELERRIQALEARLSSEGAGQ